MANHPNIVALGEILWDVFPDGPRFGGAPANFACHAAALGGRSYLISAVGTDRLGDLAITQLQLHQVDTSSVVRHPDYPTGQVQVQVDQNGQPHYNFGENDAWDHLDWSESIEKLTRQADAVCFGTLGQRMQCSRETIQRYVDLVPQQSLRIFDINLRAPYFDDEVIEQSLNLANLLKLNDGELEALSSIFTLSGSVMDRLHELAQRFELQLVALSRGDRGAILMRGDEVSEFEGIEVRVRDTVGAGDAYTAALVLGLLGNHDLQTINRHACHVAAFVCSQAGATPSLPEELAIAAL